MCFGSRLLIKADIAKFNLEKLDFNKESDSEIITELSL